VKFKRGDLVKIKNKSTGRALRTIRKEVYDITKPQQIERIDGRIIVIRGDYYRENDLESVYSIGDISNLFDNLIEEL
jgi:hypothetical protein